MAAAHGLILLLQYLHEHGCPWDIKTCVEAAKTQHLDCLLYALRNGCSSEQLCSVLAYHDQLEGLKAARECGAQWTTDTCRRAIQGGSVRCLTYALTNGAPTTGDLCAHAALYGQLECLELCHRRRQLRSTEVCRCAAKRGSLECLKFAHENGYPWSPEVCFNAAQAGHIDCLLYARKHGCPTETFSEGFLRCWDTVKKDVLKNIGL
jgi:hypothetical protein